MNFVKYGPIAKTAPSKGGDCSSETQLEAGTTPAAVISS